MRRVGLALVAVLAVLSTLAAPASAEAAASRSPKITFYFGLERPEAAARAAFEAVGRPGSTTYRRFLGVGQIARSFGARPKTVRAFRRAARRHGFTARVDRSGVFARLTGRVKRFEHVFGVRIRKQFDNDVLADSWVVGGDRRLRLPRDLRPLVRERVAFSARTTKLPPSPRAVTAQTPTGGPKPANAGTWTGGCAAAKATGGYGYGQVRTAYGLEAVGSGAGASVAVLGVGEGPIPGDTAKAGACFGLPSLKPRTLLTDGQARPFGPGSPEPSEDLALVRGMAPGISTILLSQVWLSPEAWFLGASQTLAARRLPDALSISYGECERDVRGRRAGPSSRGNAELLDSLLLRLGLAGVGVFASAGDFGSTCNNDDFAGVAWPASSPFLTAVGGSRLVLDAANARVDEVVWNDLQWLSKNNGGGAGGGGLSSASARPSYQGALTVPGRRRAVPDLAAHASMLPGWPVLFGSSWLEDAGTSSSAPLVAGAFAVLSARERAAGRPPLGPVNGLIYSLEKSAPDTFFDIVTGDNGYLAKVPAISAAPGYDMASGLGVPRFDRLAAALPPPAP
jgi:subtilase family serine protease